MPAHSDSVVTIYLLGTPAVKWAGEQLSIPRRHVRGLLYLLATQTLPSTRETLCLLFWPDHPEASAHRNLTRALTHLRRALPAHEALQTDRETVHLDEQHFWSDVLEFRRSAQKVADLKSLGDAIELYRGDFLQGFYLPGCLDFERWVSQESIALERSYLRALSCLIGAKAATQDYVSAIHYARRYLTVDGLAEEMHRCLMSLYVLNGDRSSALYQYESCVSILERELGIKPLPETRATYQNVLEGRVEELKTAWLETVQEPPLRLEHKKAPLVGRSAELELLEKRFQQMRAGQSRVVLISGEPGIGKSRMLADFVELYRELCHVYLGSGQLAERNVPYHAVVEALRSAPALTKRTLSPIWCAEVARILPELRAQYPDLPPPVSLRGEEARIRLFEALCRYILSLSGDEKPILLCFDDLHWFDRTSLSWLIYLCHQFSTQNKRVMIVATYRSEDVGRIQELRDNLAKLDLLDEIHLPGLDDSSILELIRRMYINTLTSDTFASKLKRATGGNPFFVLETLRSLDEEGKQIGNLDEVMVFPLPKVVQEAISRRLGRLNARSQQVLEAGAILGNAFSFKVVRFTAGRSELETSSALDLLVNRQLLSEEAGQHHFSHDLVRRAVLANISPMRSQLLHSRAGRAMEKLKPEEVSALAEHFDAGSDWYKALHYHELCANRAESLFAWQEAGAHLERCLKILMILDPNCSQREHLTRRFQISSGLIRLHYLQGRLDQRDADLLILQNVAESLADPRFTLKTLLLKVRNQVNDASYQDAIYTAKEGLDLANRIQDNNTHAHLLAQMGLAYHMLGLPVEALALLQSASSKIESSDVLLNSLVLINMAQVYRVLGDYQHALDCAQGAYAIHREKGDPYGAARYVDIGYLYANLGCFQKAKDFLAECLAIAQKAGVRIYEAHALLAIGGTHLFQADPVSAIENCQAALVMLEGLRSENLSASAFATIGFAYYHLGNLDQSHQWLVRGLEAARSIGHRMRVAQVLLQLALLEISVHQIPAAASWVHEGLTIAREIRAAELISTGLAIAARVERLNKKPDKAKGYAQEALHYAQKHDLRALEKLARVEVALALVELGRLPSAYEHTSEAIHLIPTSHQLWISDEQVYRAHSRVLKRLGEIQAAEEHECIAREILQDKVKRIPDPALRATFLTKSSQAI